MYWETARGYTSGRSRRISPSRVIASLISLGWPREVILSASLCSLVPSLNVTIRSVVCVPALKSGNSSQAVARENSARSSWTAERLISVDLDIVSLDPYFSAYAETLGTIETLVKQKGCATTVPTWLEHPGSVRGGGVNYREDGHSRARESLARRLWEGLSSALSRSLHPAPASRRFRFRGRPRRGPSKAIS